MGAVSDQERFVSPTAYRQIWTDHLGYIGNFGAEPDFTLAGDGSEMRVRLGCAERCRVRAARKAERQRKRVQRNIRKRSK